MMPSLQPVSRALKAGDQSDLWASLVSLGKEDEAALALAADYVADQPGAADLMSRWAAAEPANPLALSLLAGTQINDAWAIRSGRRASEVNTDAFEGFFGRLREAEQNLIKACAIEPDVGLPWHLRLFTARGLELGVGESQRRYDRLMRISPHHFPGQAAMLQNLCTKWGGEPDAALAFARSCSSAAPPGSANGALVAIAHLEEYVARGPKDGASYMHDAGVRAELSAAAAQSVDHSDYRVDKNGPTPSTVFGIAFAVAGESPQAFRHLQIAGENATESWFGYLVGTDAATVADLRRRAGVA